MKRTLIISGFFVLMISLSFFIATAAATWTMDKTEVKYRKLSDKLTDKEIVEEKIERNEYKKYVKYYETIETRTRNRILGWSTKIDTTKTYIMEESD